MLQERQNIDTEDIILQVKNSHNNISNNSNMQLSSSKSLQISLECVRMDQAGLN